MTKRIQHVAPLQLGIVLAVLYGILSLIFVPFFIIAAMFSANVQGGSGGVIGSIGFIIVLPILYAVFGFIGGVIAGAIYNLVAKWSGGIELTFADVPGRLNG